MAKKHARANIEYMKNVKRRSKHLPQVRFSFHPHQIFVNVTYFLQGCVSFLGDVLVTSSCPLPTIASYL